MKIRKVKLTESFKEFFDGEKSSGILLIICTIVSLLITNSAIGANYLAFWQTKAGGLSVEHWVNDALMAIFFLLIGLELKREFYKGELSNFKTALLPIVAALGVLALLGSRVPASLKVFLTALAVMDDLGAIIVIAVFYTAEISLFYLFLALVVFVFLLSLRYFPFVKSLIPYLLGGALMWF